MAQVRTRSRIGAAAAPVRGLALGFVLAAGPWAASPASACDAFDLAFFGECPPEIAPVQPAPEPRPPRQPAAPTPAAPAASQIAAPSPSRAVCPGFDRRDRYLSRTAGQLGTATPFDVTAGGRANLEACEGIDGVGYTARFPVLSLDFTADGRARTLVFTVDESCDATLLVNTPAGDWLFNDDFGAAPGPVVQIPAAQDGTYDVWVGSYGATPCAATLNVTAPGDLDAFLSSIGAVGATAGAPAQAGFGYEFTNRCRHPVQLAIQYMDLNGVWQSRGWWTFAPKETAMLTLSGQQIVSNNSVWYFYAECLRGGACVWDGGHRAEIDGETVSMQEVRDEEGINDWYVACD